MTKLFENKTNQQFKIKSKNTKPEVLLRSSLYKKGYRFKIHVSKLPGKPDIVLAKYNLILNVHGCYWHNHGCPNSRIPKTRQDYWLNVFEKTKMRDFVNKSKLQNKGWRVHDVWECALKDNLEKEISYIERLMLAA